MLCWISIVGGLLIMMGQHDRSEALFYYFRLEDQVPENHLLRLIEKHISFEFVRERLRDSYSETGRPSIDPELLLRVLLIGYLYGISSERKLVEELRMHLAWRWFTGLGFDQEIPHHSTFSKNRHGRFQESKLFEQLFEQIVRQCVEVGLVQGQHLSVDGSFVEANAAKESRIPREQLGEAAQVHHSVRQYLKELEQQNPVEEPVHEQDRVSTTDPDSTYATKAIPDFEAKKTASDVLFILEAAGLRVVCTGITERDLFDGVTIEQYLAPKETEHEEMAAQMYSGSTAGILKEFFEDNAAQLLRRWPLRSEKHLLCRIFGNLLCREERR